MQDLTKNPPDNIVEEGRREWTLLLYTRAHFKRQWVTPTCLDIHLGGRVVWFDVPQQFSRHHIRSRCSPKRFSVYGVEHNPQSTKWWLAGSSLAAQVCDLVCAFGPCTLFSNEGHLVDFASTSVIARAHRKKTFSEGLWIYVHFRILYLVWAPLDRPGRKTTSAVFFSKNNNIFA